MGSENYLEKHGVRVFLSITQPWLFSENLAVEIPLVTSFKEKKSIYYRPLRDKTSLP